MNLTGFMRRKKLTQRELGEKLNLSTSFIGQMLRRAKCQK
jgi:DNA-binding transcriptional regulator LsrR (DeoR family)